MRPASGQWFPQPGLRVGRLQDDEAARRAVRTVSPRASSMLPCRTFIGEEVAGEVDADIEVEGEVDERRATQSRSHQAK